MSSPSSPTPFLFPSAFLLPTGPLGPLSSSAPTGLFSPSSPTGLFSPFSPRTEKAAKAEHAATDGTPPTLPLLILAVLSAEPSFHVSIPIILANLLCRSGPRAFVKPSATISSVGQYSNRNLPSSTQFLTK